MTDYWVDTGNHWCKFCKCWVKQHKEAIAHHEAGNRHQNAMRMFFKNQRETKKVRAEYDNTVAQEMARIEQLAAGSLSRTLQTGAFGSQLQAQAALASSAGLSSMPKGPQIAGKRRRHRAHMKRFTTTILYGATDLPPASVRLCVPTAQLRNPAGPIPPSGWLLCRDTSLAAIGAQVSACRRPFKDSGDFGPRIFPHPRVCHLSRHQDCRPRRARIA